MQSLVISIALVWHEGRLLIARRKAEAHQGLKWEFPGGKVEVTETAEAAVLREVLEETGLSVSSLGERRRIRHDYPERSVELVVFDCRAEHSNARALASEVVRWVEPAELSRYEFPAANRDLIAELVSAPPR